jgi:molybdenum cofactor biosynthesis protein MoaC
VKLYGFDGIDEQLELLPLAARRALDRSGAKLSLEAWQGLPLAKRRALVEAGSEAQVDAPRVQSTIAGARPAAGALPPRPDLVTTEVPEVVASALGPERPVPLPVWASLSALDRYALVKVAERGKPERLQGAYQEIVGHSLVSTHVAPGGGVRMIDVGEKAITRRRAVAESAVHMNAEALERLARATAPKGDVLGTARLAGIMAAKRTAEWIPLCHPLHLTKIAVDLQIDRAESAVRIEASVEAMDRTGVEMEALVAASAAALTVYDMLKAFDRAMEIGPTRLLAKSGGRSGDYSRSAAAPSSSERRRLVELRDGALSVDEVEQAVARPEAGGVVVFVGTVRSTNDGYAVTELEYSAYESMAAKELLAIVEELEREMPEVRLAVTHRVGRLALGDAAVVCAASAPHREAAFVACRALIDRIKARVPIWKREHGPEGPHWVGWQDVRPTGSGEPG